MLQRNKFEQGARKHKKKRRTKRINMYKKGRLERAGVAY